MSHHLLWLLTLTCYFFCNSHGIFSHFVLSNLNLPSAVLCVAFSTNENRPYYRPADLRTFNQLAAVNLYFRARDNIIYMSSLSVAMWENCTKMHLEVCAVNTNKNNHRQRNIQKENPNFDGIVKWYGYTECVTLKRGWRQNAFGCLRAYCV